MDTFYIESLLTIPNYYFSCLISVPYGMLLALLMVAPLKKGNIYKLLIGLSILILCPISAFITFPFISIQSIPAHLASVLVAGDIHPIQISANTLIMSISAGLTLLLFVVYELTVTSVKFIQQENAGETTTVVYINDFSNSFDKTTKDAA
jgi:hypothetical protein